MVAMRKTLLPGTLALLICGSLSAADPSLTAQKDPQPAPDGAVLARGVRTFGIALRHPNGIAQLRYSPDGAYLASAGRRGKLMVWNPATGELLADIKTQLRSARDLVFSSDSQTVAAAFDRDSVVTFDLSTRTEQKTTETTYYATAIALPSDAADLLTAFGARTASLGNYRLGEKKPLQSKLLLTTQRAVKTHLTAISQDARRVVFEVDTDFVVFDTETGKRKVAFEVPSRTIRKLRLSNDGGMLAAVDRTLVRVWSVADGKLLFDARAPNTLSARFSPDGKRLATCGSDGVHFWDTETGGLKEQFPLRGALAVDIVRHGEGYQIAVAVNDRIHLLDAETGKAALSGLGHLQPARQIEFARPPSKLIVSGGSGGQVIAWNRETGEKQKVLTGYPSGQGLALSADGSLLAIGGTKLQLWNTAGWTAHEVPAALNVAVSSVTFDRPGKILAVGLPTGEVLVWKVDGDQVTKLAAHKAAVSLLRFDSTGQRLCSAAKGSNVVVWDLATGDPLREVTWNSKWRNPVGLVGEHTLSTSESDQSLRLLDLMHRVEFKSSPTIPRKGTIMATDYTPDGRFAAVAGSDNVIRVREVASGREMWAWRARNRVYALRWSQDQRQLLAGEDDGRLVLWDLPFPEHTDETSLDSDHQLLATDKALPAWQALNRLAKRGQPAVARVAATMKAKGHFRTDLVAQLIERLDHDLFEIREHAQVTLRDMGAPVLPSIRDAILNPVSAESRARLRLLRSTLDQPQAPNKEVWQALRAIALLETVGGDDAQQALRRVSGGNSQMAETRAARAALARLTGEPEATRVKAKFNKVLDLGSPAPDFRNLPGTDGKQHSLSDYQQAKVLVVIFTCNHCPVATTYEQRFVQLAAQHEKQGVQVVAISPSVRADDRLEGMKQRAKQSGFNFPYLWDQSQQAARAFGVYVTPQIFVLDSDRRVAYTGAFDDNLTVAKVTQHYVVDSVKALLAGRQPEVRESRPNGCEIEYQPE